MKNFLYLVLLLFTGAALSAGPYNIKNFNLNKADGIYKAGETVVVTGLLASRNTPVTVGTLRCNIKWEGKVVETRDFPCDGKSFSVSYKADKPGWVYFEFLVLDKDGKEIPFPGRPPQMRQRPKLKRLVAEIGAIFEPEKIRSTFPCPSDLKEYWAKQRNRLAQVPMETVIQEIASPDPRVKLYTLEVKSVEEPVTGYLAIPADAAAKSHPAVVYYQSWVWSDTNYNTAVQKAAEGAIALAATWHGRKVGQPKEYYAAEQKIFGQKGLRRKYVHQPEKWFANMMYLRVLRALDYIKSRPEWDGESLAVVGGSLGGAEASCAAALDKDVKMALINIPCFCEFNAVADGRKRSIPFGGWSRIATKEAIGVSYLDLVNLTKLMNCEVYFSTGFADELCPPSNLLAAYNNLPAGTKKHLYTNPRTGHYGTTVNKKALEALDKYLKTAAERGKARR